MRDPNKVARLAIADMLDAIENVRAVLADFTFEQFAGSYIHLRATERAIEIISEASRRIPSGIKETEPEIPWAKIAGIGNVLRHDYDDVAPRAIWNVIEVDLPPLEEALRRILERIDENT